VTPRTRLIRVTRPHNPTGTMMPWEDLVELERIGICGSAVDQRLGRAILEERDVWLDRSRERNLRHLGIVS